MEKMTHKVLLFVFFIGALFAFSNGAITWAAAPGGQQDVIMVGGYEFYFVASPATAAKSVRVASVAPQPVPFVSVDFNNGTGWNIEAPFAPGYQRAQTFTVESEGADHRMTLIVLLRQDEGIFLALPPVEHRGSAVIITAEFRTNTMAGVQMSPGVLNGQLGNPDQSVNVSMRYDADIFQYWKRVVARFDAGSKPLVTPFLQVAADQGLPTLARGEAGVQVRNIRVYRENDLTPAELVYLYRGTTPSVPSTPVPPAPTNTPVAAVPTNTPVPQPQATATPTATSTPRPADIWGGTVVSLSRDGTFRVVNGRNYLDSRARTDFDLGQVPKIVGDFQPGWSDGPALTIAPNGDWLIDMDGVPMPNGVNRFQIKVGGGWFKLEDLPAEDQYNFRRQTRPEDGGLWSMAIVKNGPNDYTVTYVGTIVADRS